MQRNGRNSSTSIAAGTSTGSRRSFGSARTAKGLTTAVLSIVTLAAPLALHAQAVSFANVQTTLPASGLNLPIGVAVDRVGNVFIAENGNSRVVELPWTGGGYGVQITLPTKGLNQPGSVAVDETGDVFIADTINNRVVELPWTGNGYGAQITVPASGLNQPYGIAVDKVGDVFIADTYHNRVVEVPWTGSGYGAQTTVQASGLSYPFGMTVDGNGDLFIADTDNTRVVEVPWTGSGYGAQTTVPASGLYHIADTAVDGKGDVFIADTDNNRVVEEPWTGSGYGAQITLPISGLNGPWGVTVDGAGDIFIADVHNNRVVEVQTQSVIFGSANVCPAGAGTPAPCNQTATLTYTMNASTSIGSVNVLAQGMPNLDFTLSSTTCTGAQTAGSTCTVTAVFAPTAPGLRSGAVQLTDNAGNVLATTPIYGQGQGPAIAYGPGTQSILQVSGVVSPEGIAVDAAGDLFVVDHDTQRVVKVPANGGAQITVPTSGVHDPEGVAVDGAGDVFIADIENSRVVEVPWTGSGYGAQITVPANGLNFPTEVAVDGAGNVFIVDHLNSNVVEVPWTGNGYGAQITLPTDGLSYPTGVAVDGAGDVFIADSFNSRVVEVPWTGNGYGAQTTVPVSGLSYIDGVAVDGVGNLFIADYGNSRVVEVPVNGGAQVTMPVSGFPQFVAVDEAGNLFYTWSNESAYISEIQRSTPPALSFAATNVGQSSSPQSVTIQNIGNQPLTASGLSIGANFAQVAGSGTPEDCTGSFSLAPDAECNLSISFEPVAGGSIQSSAVLTDNALNGNPATQSIALSGTAQQTVQIILSWPTITPYITMLTGENLEVYGTENGSTKATVGCAVQNTTTGLWLQADGSYAATQYWFPASIFDASGDWRWAYTPNAVGTFRVIAQVTDGGSVNTAQSTYTVAAP